MSEYIIWQTKGGHKVRIVCTDRPGTRPIIGYFLKDPSDLNGWRCDGRCFGHEPSKWDLVIPEGTGIGASE